jgi:replicative DNA helicase
MNRQYRNIDLERDVLRAVLHNPDTIYTVTTVSTDAAFFEDARWAIIWRAMLRLVEQGSKIDPSLIRSTVMDRGWMTDSEAQRTIDELMAARESARHLDDWVAELFRFYQRRQLVQAAGMIENEIERGTSGEDVIQKITQQISTLNGTRARYTIAETADAYEKETLNAVTTGTLKKGLMTPFPLLNKITNGLGKDWLILIAGLSGTGKTTMALQMVDSVLENTNERVAVISLEMSPASLTERLAGQRSLIPGERLRNGSFIGDDETRFRAAMASLRNNRDRLVMYTQQSFMGRPTAEKMEALVRVEHARGALGLIVIDYFQLFAQGKLDYVNLQCNTINGIAKKLGIPVLMLAQLNRGSQRERRPPETYDLRDTSVLENDPDLILMLDRKDRRYHRDAWAMEGIIEGEIDCYIRKFRYGPTGELKLMFDGQVYLFTQTAGTTIGAAQPATSASDILLGVA